MHVWALIYINIKEGLENKNSLKVVSKWGRSILLKIEGSPWYKGKIRLEVDKESSFSTSSLNATRGLIEIRTSR